MPTISAGSHKPFRNPGPLARPRQRIRPLRGLGFLLAAWLLASQSMAGDLTGTMPAKMVLTSGCLISGGSGAQTGLGFGTLDFGAKPGTFTGIVDAVPAGGDGGSGTTQIICSPEVTTVSITVSGGLHAGQGGSVGAGARAMQSGSAYLPYEVYQDPSRSTVYPVGSALTGFSIPVSGTAFNLPIYGRVNKTSSISLPAGTYTDTLQITLTF